jgi:hypothetical protein
MMRKQKWLEIEKNLGVPEKQYIVGNCDYHLGSLAASEAQVVGGPITLIAAPSPLPMWPLTYRTSTGRVLLLARAATPQR